jgi:hypothetical protein
MRIVFSAGIAVTGCHKETLTKIPVLEREQGDFLRNPESIQP